MNARITSIGIPARINDFFAVGRSHGLRICALILAVFVLTPAIVGQAQVTGASVDESPIGTYYYVDAVRGRDANAGTYNAPFASIGKAISLAAGVIKSGVKISVN